MSEKEASLKDWGKYIWNVFSRPQGAKKTLQEAIGSQSTKKMVGEALEAGLKGVDKKVQQDIGKHLGTGFVDKVRPALKAWGEKEAPKIFARGLEQAERKAKDVATDAVRRITGAAAIGATAGAASAPSGSRPEGAVHGAVGGIIGGVTGAAWGKSLLPAVGGAILGGATAGTMVKENAMHGFKYAGVTLDWYDDQGETLKQKFPKLDDVPEIIKTANVLPKEKVSNEQFALVMIDEGHVFRKFACADPGTTAMSTIYFMEHGDKLPEGAKKLAAANLVDACVEHGLLPPAAMTKEARSAVAKYIRAAGKAVGQKLRSPATKGNLMLASAVPTAAVLATKDDLPAEKSKEVNDNVISVTGQRPKPVIKQAQAESDDDYALVLADGTRKYPIHTWDLVKKASDYYHDNKRLMHPEHRRQYAVKLARKSFIMGFPLDGEITELGAVGYNSDGHLKAAVEMRKVACDPSGPGRGFLDDLFEKHAEMHPEVYAEVLKRFDIEEGLDRGWDQVIPDPWSSTFGVKTAAVVWEEGADRVTDDALHNLAENHIPRLQMEWTDDFANEFRKDPVGIFNSLPTPQKKLLARFADDMQHDGGSEYGAAKANG